MHRRFDLLHVMVDEPNDIHDYAIANHIVNVHRDGPAAFDVAYSIGQMQRYIKFARTFKPEITPESARLLVESYKHLRADDAAPGSNSSYRITVRQLEALIRLSQALARVRCSERVNPAHVKEVCLVDWQPTPVCRVLPVCCVLLCVVNCLWHVSSVHPQACIKYVFQATRLLKHSIMAVEAPDVTLDEEEGYQEELEGAAAALRQALSGASGEAAAGTAPTQAADVTGSNPTPVRVTYFCARFLPFLHVWCSDTTTPVGNWCAACTRGAIEKGHAGQPEKVQHGQGACVMLAYS